MRPLSLRTRLVLGVLLLALIGLIVADVATYASLNSFLIHRTDKTLAASHREIETELQQEIAGQPSRLGEIARSLPGLYVEARTLSGSVIAHGQVAPFRETEHEMSPPDLP